MDLRQDQLPERVAGLVPLRLVGRGSEGQVWEAVTPDGRSRALKLISPQWLADDAEDRIEALRRIDHPALVRVHDGGILDGGGLDGWGYLEMDFVDGPSLHREPPLEDALEELWPLAEALDLLHVGAWSGGVPMVHRDIKPANIVRGRDGELVLVDPSTLRGVDATQLTRVGTPLFCAPEVVTGRFSGAADVYSFAATAVALVSGARGQALAAVLEDPAAHGLPGGVVAALSERPGDRPVSCRAVLEGTARWQPAAPLAGWDGDGSHLVEPVGHREEGAWDEHPAMAAASPPRWGRWWLVLVAGVALPALLGAGALGSGVEPVGWQPPVAAVLLALAVHVVAHAVTRRAPAVAVLVPPVAWALLIGHRTGGRPRRQAFATSALLPPLVILLGAPVATALDVPAGPAALAAAVGAVAVAAVAGVTTAHGAVARLGRLLLLPAWFAGAAVLLVAGAALLPLARRRRRGLWRWLGLVVAGGAEVLRRP